MKSKFPIKKLLLMVLLCAGIFLAVHKQKDFYEIREYYALNFFEETYSLMGEKQMTVDQEFVAKGDALTNVYLRFYIENQVTLDGRISVQVKDPETGTALFTTSKTLKKLTHTETADWTEFYTDIDLEKGKTYILELNTYNVSGDGECALYLSRNKQGLFKNLNLNGEDHSKRLVATFKYDTHCTDDMVKMILLMILCGGFLILTEFSKPKKLFRKWMNKIPKVHVEDGNHFVARALFIATPVLAFHLMQTFCGYNLVEFFEHAITPEGPFNLLIYTVILMVFYLITNRMKYAGILTMVLTYVAGLINYFVWDFRGCPVVAADLFSIGTAMNVAEGYEYKLGFPAVWATILLIAYIACACGLKTCKGLKFKQRVAYLLITALLTSGSYGIFFHTGLMKALDISVSVWMPERDYAQTGCALSYLLTWTYYIVEKPSGYSPERVAEIADGYVSDEVSGEALTVSEEHPNIIAIMNESFSDLGVDADIKTSEDFMPFIRGLTENTVKGNLYVSVLGGNTANSEFEFLTGNSISYFPSRSIPYNSYLKHQTGSLTWTLLDQGYIGGQAIHPYFADGWNRPAVYPMLGFNQFISYEDFKSPRTVRDFVSDQTDFDRLIAEYEEARKTDKTTPFYEFSVTMQNHGGYSGVHGLIEENIKVTSPSDANDQIVQYVNLIKESDKAFENLTKYFSKVKEPTVIVMFGDHQPGFTDSAYDQIFGRKTSSLPIEETVKMYQVPYIIWANYDIEEGTKDMSANYLSSFFLKTIGSNLTGYNKYLLDLMEKVPVVTAICYMGDDGILHPAGEESEYSELLKEYQTIQYNNIFDVGNRQPDFFYLKGQDRSE